MSNGNLSYVALQTCLSVWIRLKGRFLIKTKKEAGKIITYQCQSKMVSHPQYGIHLSERQGTGMLGKKQTAFYENKMCTETFNRSNYIL